MFRSLCSRRVVAAGLLLLASAPAWANNPLPDAEAEKARRLVRQLGAADFRAREQASTELVRMGSAVEPILREGLDYPDPEVRFRCRHLLPLAMSYDLERRLQAFLGSKNGKEQSAPPGWSRFKEIVGDDRHTRDLFAAMHRYDTELLTKLEKNPGAVRDKLEARCVDLAQMQNYNYNAAVNVVPEQLAFILFACLDPKVKLNPEAQSHLTSALTSLSYRSRTKEVVKSNTAVRKLLVKYVSYLSEECAYSAINGLNIMANLELKEVVDLARRVLKSSENDQNGRGIALAVLGRFGGKDVVPEVLPYLDDKTNVGETQFGNGNRIKTEMRDVALATLVQATGQSMKDYDFAYLQMFGGRVVLNNISMSPSLLGFSDNATRDAAMKKWKDWYAKNKQSLSQK